MIDFDSTSLSQLRAIGTGEFDYERAVSGRSLVRGVSEEKSRSDEASERRDWPHSFTDYLRRYIGRPVRVEHTDSGGRQMAAAGMLQTVGTDFVGLRSARSGEQVLICLASITRISVPGGQ